METPVSHIMRLWCEHEGLGLTSSDNTQYQMFHNGQAGTFCLKVYYANKVSFIGGEGLGDVN